ncbi:type III pantothenate kinase [Marinilabilia rubra]|uniref:Type III pantothenate kinase n=1 Tax=Marinilabilia rubra TaxID=2162893 RepID=A0A2U2BED3_9BACT|nr:type III pantothenate kinase [Marinilabilia rubra]PWE01421.1 type III pantothenate kinase [Marinilabilia rubra]
MNLTIDQGNSSTKLGFFDKGEVIATYKLDFLDQKNMGPIIKRHSPTNAVISSVTRDKSFFKNFFSNLPGQLIFFDHTTPIPLKNNYKTPETLGKDRLAAVIGANTLYPGYPLLVIDAGTAVTFDLVSHNIYHGGNISPGLSMRYKALHQQTQKLPMVTPGDGPFWGGTTEEAIRAGVKNSLIMEIEGYISQVKEEYPDAKTIITGGDADFFVSYTKNIIFVHPNLVLSGLNRIIEYNA